MPDAITLQTLGLAAFLAFCRIGACFMLMPGFGSFRVPAHVRLFIAVAVSWALLWHLWDYILPHLDSGADTIAMLIASELLIGALIGLVTRFYVLALQFIGSAIAMTTGFSTMTGPTVDEPDPVPALGAILTTSALLMLFIFEFHHEIVRALVASYEVAPLALLFAPGAALADLADTLSESFYIMLRLGSPFIAYGILVNLATGLINKLAPQIPVYFIALPFFIAGGLIMMYFAIPTLLSLFIDGFMPTTLAR